MKIKIFLLAVTIALITSCTKSDDKDAIIKSDPSGKIIAAGYGSSLMPFAEISWKLPANVQLEDSIHDYSYCWAFAPFSNIPPAEWKGVPLGFTFCLTLKNNNPSSPVIIDFPPQVIFTSSSNLYQNILTIQLGSVVLLAGETKTIVAQGFCINKGRHPPQTYLDDTENFLTYNFGPSAVPSALQEIIDIVKSKNITMDNILKPDGTIDNEKTAKYIVIQQAIWEATDEDGLTEATKSKLLAL